MTGLKRSETLQNLSSHWYSQNSDIRAARQLSTSTKYGMYPGALSSFGSQAGSVLESSRLSRTNKAPLNFSSNDDSQNHINWHDLLGGNIRIDTEPSSLSDAVSTQAVDTPIRDVATVGPTSGQLVSLSPTRSSIVGSTVSCPKLVCSAMQLTVLLKFIFFQPEVGSVSLPSSSPSSGLSFRYF